MRRLWVAVIGFGVGRYAVSAGSSEQSAELANAEKSAEFEVFNPRPFASPPNLEVVDPLPRDTFGRWVFPMTEQRADGFKINVGYSPAERANPTFAKLSCVAKGLPAT